MIRNVFLLLFNLNLFVSKLVVDLDLVPKRMAKHLGEWAVDNDKNSKLN